VVIWAETPADRPSATHYPSRISAACLVWLARLITTSAPTPKRQRISLSCRRSTSSTWPTRERFAMMTSVLRRRGREINRKRVQRLMRLMGIRSLCPQPKTTTPNKAHPVYPYLLARPSGHSTQPGLGGRHHLHPLQKRILVLGRDHGLALAKSAVLAPRQHHDRGLCVAALNEALALYGAPEIFNSDPDRNLPPRPSPRCSWTLA